MDFCLNYHFFLDVFAEAHHEIVTAAHVGDELSFQVENGEWVQARVAVSEAQLAHFILAPSPD